MAERRRIDDIYDVLTGAKLDLEREYAELAAAGMRYTPDPRLVHRGPSKQIKSPTYVGEHDYPARHLDQTARFDRQRVTIQSRDSRARKISLGLPEDLSLVPCNLLRSALGRLSFEGQNGYDSELKANTHTYVSFEIKQEINRRCVPKSQRRSY